MSIAWTNGNFGDYDINNQINWHGGEIVSKIWNGGYITVSSLTYWQWTASKFNISTFGCVSSGCGVESCCETIDDGDSFMETTVMSNNFVSTSASSQNKERDHKLSNQNIKLFHKQQCLTQNELVKIS